MEINITKNKVLDIGFAKVLGEWCHYFNFHIGWSRKVDHAGFSVFFTIMRFSPYFEIRDVRHWNRRTNNWAANQEESEE